MSKYLQKLPFASQAITPNFRKIVSNISWLFIDRLFRMGGSLIIGIWIARYLGLGQYGVFNYATAFVALFSPLLMERIDGLAIREITLDFKNTAEILGTLFWLKLLGAAISLILSVGLISVLRVNDLLTIQLVATLSTIGLFQSFDVIDIWFQSQRQSKYAVFARNSAFIVASLFRVLLIKLQAPTIAFAWVSILEFSLAALCLSMAYVFKGHSIKLWRWSSERAKSLLREGFPLILSGLAVIIYVKIDQIMLGEMIGSSAIGVYAAATRLSEALYLIPSAIIPSLSPSIYSAKELDEATYQHRIVRLLRLMVVIAVVLSLLITVTSEPIILILFGEEYRAAIAVLVIHVWASPFVFMGGATTPWFIAEGLTGWAAWRTVMGAVINILLNLWLIPAYAAKGAAIATVISYCAAGFLSHAFHDKTKPLFLLQIKSMMIWKKI